MRTKKRIIVATLDYNVFRSVSQRLARDDYEICLVQKDAAVLTEILDGQVDLLMLDLELAGVLGLDLLPVIRRIRPRLPVILITDDVTQRIRKVAAEQGITYQVFKPVSAPEADDIVSIAERVITKTSLPVPVE